ncbi:flavodoxin family protein [Desulfurivibrio sp. D14AmB]|uniref:flavodoxin family protein n=1 Tax=Desulfurivibrio sp. D14AmB TaxID=3374370 RepID=UPI00376EE61A
MAKIKVLAFNGSPRAGGNTATMLAALAEGVVAAGGEIEIIRLCDLTIQPCVACGGCDESGECVLVDDMTQLYEKIIAADRVVLASPIYFYGITAQAKAMVDRTQALWNRWRVPGGPGRRAADPSRRGLLLAVAATSGAKVFDGAILTAKYAFDAMGFAHGGELLVRGLEQRLDAAARPEALREAGERGRKLLATLSA